MGDIDTDARERIAEIAGRLAVHERHCEERNANLRAFMDQIERQTERINQRLTAIWRWIVGVLGVLIVTTLGLLTNVLSRTIIT